MAEQIAAVAAVPARAPAVSPEERARVAPIRILVGRVLAVALPLSIWFAPLNMDTTARHALAIGLFMIVSWITDAMPHAIAGLVGCYLFWALNVAKFDAAFSGFANETTWFFYGALMFGLVATETGLARRLAANLLLRVGNVYSHILLGMIVLSFLLTFLVPSGAACVVIMASIASGLLQAYGYDKGSNIARGMFITLTYTAGLFDKMIVGGVSSIMARGLIIKSAHVEILWSKWFLAYLPMSLLTILFAWRLILWLYPPEQKAVSGGAEYLTRQLRAMGPWTAAEKRGLAIMLIAIALWMTDFLHHISPAIIGLGAGLFAALPGVGVLDFEAVKKVNVMAVFFVGTAASLGQVLIQTKALDVITRVAFGWMTPLLAGKFLVAFVPYWTAVAYHVFLGSEISMLASSVPPLMNFAAAHHISPVPLGMVWAFAAGGKIFVYQSAVMVVGYSYGYFETKDMLKVGLLLTAIESLMLLLLVPVYWPLIGIR